MFTSLKKTFKSRSVKAAYLLVSFLCLSATVSAANASQPNAVLSTSIGNAYTPQVIDSQNQIEAAKGVINRLIPNMASNFNFEVINSADGYDVFELQQQGKVMTLRGNTGVSLCSAFNYYLQNYLHGDVSWNGLQVTLPDELPTIKKKITVVNPAKHRVYFNYTVFSYSMPWWDWTRWQQEIDLMALKGINMPLSVTGLEVVWYNTLLNYGYSDKEAREFLVGPSFMAWQWMANIESHGGALPKSWLQSHLTLGRQVLSAQRGLGMTPIMQGFSGFVPRDFKQRFSNATVYNKKKWVGFDGTAELEPTEALFSQFGHAFIAEQKRLYGQSDYYAADPFHESAPPRTDKKYMQDVASAIHKIIKTANPKATWVMLSWSLRKDIVEAVPIGDLLVLDLMGSKYNKTNNFWGHNFIVGNLHNFGGRINLHGDLANLADNRLKKVRDKGVKNAIGTGLFMEGIEQNPVFYSLAFDMNWQNEAIDVDVWLNNYATRRYGQNNTLAKDVWADLLTSVYKRDTSGTEESSMIAARPALEVLKSGPNRGFGNEYSHKKLSENWLSLLSQHKALQNSPGYRFDIIDLGRQTLSNLAQQLQVDIRIAFANKDLVAFKKAKIQFLQLFADLDRLLSTREEYRFDHWLNDAKSWATTAQEEQLYDFNASMLLTHWGPNTDNPSIFDYAWREWSGLIKGYYAPRWAYYLALVEQKLIAGQEINEPALAKGFGNYRVNSNDIYKKLTKFEAKWINTTKLSPISPIAGDEISIALEIAEKYKSILKQAYSAKNISRIKQFKQQYQTSNYGIKLASYNVGKFGPGKHEIIVKANKALVSEGRYEIRLNLLKAGHGKAMHIRQVEVLENKVPFWQSVEITKHSAKNALQAGRKKLVYPFEISEIAFGTDYFVKISFDVKVGTSAPKFELLLAKLK